MIQPTANLKKCLTCQRWSGWRRLGPVAASVEYDESNAQGECVEGPWHGSLRSVRNACGRWLQWAALAPGDGP